MSVMAFDDTPLAEEGSGKFGRFKIRNRTPRDIVERWEVLVLRKSGRGYFAARDDDGKVMLFATREDAIIAGQMIVDGKL